MTGASRHLITLALVLAAGCGDLEEPSDSATPDRGYSETAQTTALELCTAVQFDDPSSCTTCLIDYVQTRISESEFLQQVQALQELSGPPEEYADVAEAGTECIGLDIRTGEATGRRGDGLGLDDGRDRGIYAKLCPLVEEYRMRASPEILRKIQKLNPNALSFEGATGRPAGVNPVYEGACS